MAFGIGIHEQHGDAGKPRGGQEQIACACWFTSKGESTPLMIKYQETGGQIRTVRDIRVLYTEKKHYCGVPAIEYRCTTVREEKICPFRLIFYPEDCKWCIQMESQS